MCVENPKESTKKLQELTSKSNKFVGHKVNKHKSTSFYIEETIRKWNFKKTILPTTAKKKKEWPKFLVFEKKDTNLQIQEYEWTLNRISPKEMHTCNGQTCNGQTSKN